MRIAGGFDLVAQGMSGLMSITGEGPGRPPMKAGSPVTDITAGILACVGILAALYARQSTGKGQLVDTSLFEAGIMHTYWQSAICFATGVPPGAMGSAHPLNAPYQAFRTAMDGLPWARRIKPIGCGCSMRLVRSIWGMTPRFELNAGRMAHLPELTEELTRYFEKETSAVWLERLEKAGVPAGPVLDVKQMHTDPQALAREMIVETTHPSAGKVKSIGLPIKFSETPGAVTKPAPQFGQHTRDVLHEHGFSDAEIDELAASGRGRDARFKSSEKILSERYGRKRSVRNKRRHRTSDLQPAGGAQRLYAGDV